MVSIPLKYDKVPNNVGEKTTKMWQEKEQNTLITLKEL